MRMLHGNLKVKFPVAGGEAIYAAIFFNNRNHADDTNSVIALMGNGDLILEDRFHGVGVDHINTEAVAFFVDFKFDVGIVLRIELTEQEHLNLGIGLLLGTIKTGWENLGTYW